MLARVRVLLRRVVQPLNGAAPCYKAGPLSVDFAQRRVRLNGEEVALKPTEYSLLKAFITYRGKILKRQHLLKEIWGQVHMDGHSLHVYVAQLRQKIEPVPRRPSFIFTIPGVGYRLADEAGH